MTKSAEDYLASCVAGRHAELPETTHGTVRLDLRNNGSTDHWYLSIAAQRVEVSRSSAAADLILAADRTVFDQLAAGHARIASALMRNDIEARGNLRLLMTMRRLFPDPPGARHPRQAAAELMRAGQSRYDQRRQGLGEAR